MRIFAMGLLIAALAWAAPAWATHPISHAWVTILAASGAQVCGTNSGRVDVFVCNTGTGDLNCADGQVGAQRGQPLNPPSSGNQGGCAVFNSTDPIDCYSTAGTKVSCTEDGVQ